MARILVTGGCGFIGSAVVNHLLRRRDEVFALDNLSVGKDHWKGAPPEQAASAPTVIVADVLDAAACEAVIRETRPETVFHLAAHHFIPYCEENPRAAYDLNVTGTLNVLEFSRRHGVRNFFLASTGDVYHPNFVAHREVDPCGPVYIYGHTKMLAEQLCTRYFESKECFRSLTIGRLFNAAGPRETNPHLLAEVTRQIAVQGRRQVDVGNLWPLRDYVDVDSMAGCIVDASGAIEGIEILNIGSGKAVDVGAALQTLTSVLPFEVTIRSVPEKQRPNDRPYLCPNTSRLQRTIGRAADSFSPDTARRIFAEYPGLGVG